MILRELWLVRVSDDGEQREMLVETADDPHVWRFGTPLGPRIQLAASGVCALGETLTDCYERIELFKATERGLH